MIYGSDFIKSMGMRRSNLDRWFRCERLGLDWGGSDDGVTGPSGGTPWLPVELISERTRARWPRVSSSKWSGGQGDHYRGSLTMGWVPRWLAAVGTLLHSFDSARGAFKVSPVLQLDIEWWQILLKFVDTFNCGERRQLGQKWRLGLGLKSARYRALFIGGFG
jgi:hypothetical protein